MIGVAKHSLLCTVATARVVVTLSCVAKVGKVSNVAQVAQVCKGEMAERRSEETILAESLSYIDKNYSLLIVQVIKHT